MFEICYQDGPQYRRQQREAIEVHDLPPLFQDKSFLQNKDKRPQPHQDILGIVMRHFLEPKIFRTSLWVNLIKVGHMT